MLEHVDIKDEAPGDQAPTRQPAGGPAARRQPSRWIAGSALVVIALAVVLGGPRLNAASRAPAVRPTAQATATPQVITLLSPDANSEARRDNTAPLPQSLPAVPSATPTGNIAPGAPSAYELQLIAGLGTPHKVIVVSLRSQTMHAYADGTFLAGTYVITGRPQLPTPRGVYRVLNHIAPATLYSPWPPGSPFWYAPTPVNYTMEFRLGGFLIHDAPWHHVWGPGMNDWHYDPGAHEWQWGSHGCVSAPTPFVKWLYSWADDGTTVVIY
jgi:lipoprotein-anchoring transpeptidase ErfK/SrfK